MKPSEITLVSYYALAMSLFFAICSLFLSPIQSQVPVSLALGILASLGITIAKTVKNQQKQIDQLKKQIEDQTTA